MGDWEPIPPASSISSVSTSTNRPFRRIRQGNWYLRGQGKQAAGHFAGLIYDADKEPIGVLKGHFKPGNSKRTGYFAGRWCVGGECFATPHLEE